MSRIKHNRLSQHRRQQLIYMMLDLIGSVLIWVSFLLFRWAVYEERVTEVGTLLVPAFSFYRGLLLYPIGCMIVYYLSGYYMNPFRHTFSQELSLTFFSAVIISLTAFFVIVIDDHVTSYLLYYKSLLALFLLQFFISYIIRLSVSLTIRHLIKKGRFLFNTAIIGSESEAAGIRSLLTDKRVVAVIDEKDLEHFHELRERYNLSEVVVATRYSDERLYEIISKVYAAHIEIYFPAQVYDILTGVANIQTLKSAPLVCVTKHHMNDTELTIKRVSDIVFSALSLIVLSPLFLAVAIAVKVDSKGNVIYKQERIGKFGRPFNILKFRTMVSDAERDLPQLSQADDPRITRVGHWLRKFRIDELPQFWNVLVGDMSLVGPRPERKYYIDKIIEKAPYYCLLYKIRPGLTSWGPIKVGYTDTLDKMIQRLNYDIVYMENMSLKLDLKILFYTIQVIVDGRGQ